MYVLEDVGRLTEIEREEAAELHRYAFPEDPLAVDRIAGADLRRSFAIRSEGRLESVVIWRQAAVIDRGREVSMVLTGPGTTRVGRRGVRSLADHQTAFISLLREDAVLSGIDSPLPHWHQRNGWAVASAVHRYEGATEALTGYRPPADVEPWPSPDVDVLDSLLRAAYGDRFGVLARTPTDWAARLRKSAHELTRDVLVTRRDGRPVGYALVGHELTSDSTLLLRVHELAAADGDAFCDLLNALRVHNNAAGLAWDAPVDVPLWSFTPRVRHWEPRLCVDKLVRVLDVSALILAGDDVAQSAGFRLRVVDRHAPWNDGLFRIEPREAGEAALVKYGSDQDTDDAVVDIATLSMLVTGHALARLLARCGALTVRDEAGVEHLDRLFGRPYAPFTPDNW